MNSGALHWWFKFDCRVTVNTFIARICIIFPLSYYIDHSQDLQIVKSEKGCRCWRRTGPLDQTSISWLWVKGHEHRSSWLPCQRSCESRQVQYILLSQGYNSFGKFKIISYHLIFLSCNIISGTSGLKHECTYFQFYFLVFFYRYLIIICMKLSIWWTYSNAFAQRRVTGNGVIMNWKFRTSVERKDCPL